MFDTDPDYIYGSLSEKFNNLPHDISGKLQYVSPTDVWYSRVGAL